MYAVYQTSISKSDIRETERSRLIFVQFTFYFTCHKALIIRVSDLSTCNLPPLTYVSQVT